MQRHWPWENLSSFQSIVSKNFGVRFRMYPSVCFLTVMSDYHCASSTASNTFFYQFPNCLAYTSLEDCLEKLEWALANDPVPLSEESAQKLSWEGANERLFDSAAVTRDEWEEWAETGKLKSDADAARFHVETGMTGQLIGKFFTGNKSKEETKVE